MGLSDYIIGFGYLGITITIFAESGFLLGFFLPGDSLLFTVGLLASQGYFNIFILAILSTVAAVLGDNFGYYIGKKIGPSLFAREDSFFFKKKYVEDTQLFFEKHGKKTIILARFVPIVRTFAPILAGVGTMRYPTFIAYNVIGGILWCFGFLFVAFYLGRQFPGIEDYLAYIIGAIILISLTPLLRHIVKAVRKKS